MYIFMHLGNYLFYLPWRFCHRNVPLWCREMHAVYGGYRRHILVGTVEVWLVFHCGTSLDWKLYNRGIPCDSGSPLLLGRENDKISWHVLSFIDSYCQGDPTDSLPEVGSACLCTHSFSAPLCDWEPSVKTHPHSESSEHPESVLASALKLNHTPTLLSFVACVELT